MKFFITKFFFIPILLVSFLPLKALAAEVYFVPAQEVAPVGKPFPVVVWVDTKGEAINAVEGTVTLGSGLRLVSVAETDSIIGIWVRRPQIQPSRVSFSGIIPGGFESTFDPNKNLTEPGRIITLLVQADRAGEYEIGFSDIALAKHDGIGTATGVEKHSLILKATANAPKVNVNEFLHEEEDNTLPEPFEPIIYSQGDSFEGEMVLVFQTKDNQSGISYYEVRIGGGDWVKAESPYVLERSVNLDLIEVKAFDRAGNFRIAQATNYQPQEVVNISPWVIIIVGGLLAIIAFIFGRKLRGNNLREVYKSQ